MREEFGTETRSPPPQPGLSPLCLSLGSEGVPFYTGRVLCQAVPPAADSLQLGVGAWRAMPCTWIGGGLVHQMTRSPPPSPGSGTRIGLGS